MTQIGFPKPTSVKLSQYEKMLGRAKNKRTRNKKAAPRKKRILLTPYPRLTSKADTVFSVWIRNRDKRCVLCGSMENLTNGHLIKRGKKRVRWDEKNCNCLCKRCNYRDNQYHDDYVVWFINKYGEEAYKWMVAISKPLYKPSREELEGIINKYAISKG